jgi:hypothetical protein
MKYFFDLLFKTPAGAAFLLLHGILFCFALTSYFQLPWLRIETIIFYIAILALVINLSYQRRRILAVKPNSIDILLIVFWLIVIYSIATNWLPGTIKYLLMVPFFVILPYIIGRMMKDEDLIKFWFVLIIMSLVLIILLPFEYLKNYLPYPNWPSPYIFSQAHSVLLSGLLLSTTLLATTGALMINKESIEIRVGLTERKLSFLLFLFIGLLAFALAWLTARGSILIGIQCVGVLLIFSPRKYIKKIILSVLTFIIFFMLSFFSPFQNIHSKERNLQVFQSPPLLMSSNNWLDQSLTLNSEANNANYFKPILGEHACRAIKDSITDRWVHYQTALAIFFVKPIMGGGANHYGDWACTGPGSFPHSTILQVLAELGLIGGIIYLLLLAKIFQVIYRHFRKKNASDLKVIYAWLVSYTVFQVMIGQIYGNYFLSAGLYFVIGIASRLLNEEVKN